MKTKTMMDRMNAESPDKVLDELEAKRNEAAWQRKANTLARSYCPPIRPCKDCREPVVSGYCCTFCGSVSP